MMSLLMKGAFRQSKGSVSTKFWLILVIVSTMALLINGAISQPILQGASNFSYQSTPKTVPLAWPGYGQAALAADGFGLLGSYETPKPVPMASVTKAITALAVVKKKPIRPGTSGSMVTLTAQDVAIFNDYYVKGGSVVQVTQGEQISEYQMLQALLLPSANNMADTLASWAFGSMNKYTEYVNQYLKSLGLKNTHVTDASGFASESVSTAQDLAVIGQIFMKDKVLSAIVSQQQVDLPVAGTVRNTNWLLGEDGVTGIKTGNTDAAGGCFLFAADRSIGSQKVTLIGAIMGAPELNAAIRDSRTLLRSADAGFQIVKVAKKGQKVGQYNATWAKPVDVVTPEDISMLIWQSQSLSSKVTLKEIKTSAIKGTKVGTFTTSSGERQQKTPLVLAQDLPSPSLAWRLVGRYF